MTSNRTAWAVAAAFFIKAFALAFWVTPLWEVPDESAHLSYVFDLAAGRGIPVYGKTPLAPEVLEVWPGGPGSAPSFNWVAQHPPLYYVLAAPAVAAGRAVGHSPALLLKLPRLVSVFAGSVAILFLFRMVHEATAEPLLALTFAGAIACVPTFSHLSSGTHHEVLAAAGVSWAGLLWVRFSRCGTFRAGLALAAVLAVASMVKLTVVPVTLALLLLVPGQLRAPSRSSRWGQFLLIAGVALSAPLLWLLRTRLTAGHPFGHPTPGRFEPGAFLRLLATEPVLPHTFKHFVAGLGWMGAGEPRWFPMPRLLLGFYVAVFLTVCLSAASWLWREVSDRSAYSGRIACVAAFAAPVLLVGVPFLANQEAWGSVQNIAFSLPIGICLAGCVLALAGIRSFGSGIIVRAQWIVLAFCAAYLANVWRAYAIYGGVRALHGRYFFAVLPFLVLGLAYPAAIRWAHWRFRSVALCVLLGLLVVAEITLFVTVAQPFYEAGRHAG